MYIHTHVCVIGMFLNVCLQTIEGPRLLSSGNQQPDTPLLPWHRRVEGSIRATHLHGDTCEAASSDPSWDHQREKSSLFLLNRVPTREADGRTGVILHAGAAQEPSDPCSAPQGGPPAPQPQAEPRTSAPVSPPGGGEKFCEGAAALSVLAGKHRRSWTAAS